MSDKELSRINVIQSVVEKRMLRRDVACQLNLTERQTQRLMNRSRESGAAGLASLRRGRPGNHRLPESLRLRVLSLLHDLYSDYGPTLAAEKLRERHNITVSVETLRKWMTADGFGFRIPSEDHVFISLDTGVTASASLFRSTAPRMTGLKVVHQNAAYLFSSMTQPVG